METPAAAVAETPATQALVFASGTECVQASAVLAYGGGGERDGFEYEDVRGDFPEARVDSIGRPVIGPVMANYNAFTRCAGNEFLFGFYGARVKAPEWGHDGIDRHYLLIHLFYGDARTSHALGEWLGLHVDPLASGGIPHLRADTYHLAFSTGTNMGDYDGIVEVPRVERPAPEAIRLWAIREDPATGAKEYRTLDVTDEPLESGSWVGASGQGALLHWKNEMHAGGAAGQPSWSEMYSGFTRTVAYGPVFPG